MVVEPLTLGAVSAIPTLSEAARRKIGMPLRPGSAQRKIRQLTFGILF
jgi:hypothetical protein